MELTSVYLVLLNIIPNKCQFFRYENIHLSCAASGNSSSWTVRRNTSTETSQPCKDGFGDPDESSCVLSDVYPSDSGLYWCESEQGKYSNIVSITVAAGTVILESPASPVTEGDSVTLRCSYKERRAKASTSDFNATIYKNDAFFGMALEGKMTFSVSKYHEGSYKCQHPTKGESPQSFLAVRGQRIFTRRTGMNVSLEFPVPNGTTAMWLKRAGSTKYVFYCRDGHPMHPEDQEESFNDRVKGMDCGKIKSPFSITVSNLTPNDSGPYEFHRVESDGRRFNETIILKVTDPGPTGGLTGLVVVAVVLFVIGFVIYRRRTREQSNASAQPPPVELQLLEHD